MKKILTVAASLLIAASAFAQVHVGAGFANLKHSKDVDYGVNGFYVGAGYDIALGASGLTFTPGLYYMYAGAKSDYNVFGYTLASTKVKEHYLNIPLRLGYKIDAGGVVIMPYAGPVAQIGLSNKLGDHDLYDGFLKRFDLKLGFGVAADFANVIRVKAGYDLGLLNLSDTALVDNTHSHVFTIGVAYLF